MSTERGNRMHESATPKAYADTPSGEVYALCAIFIYPDSEPGRR